MNTIEITCACGGKIKIECEIILSSMDAINKFFSEHQGCTDKSMVQDLTDRLAADNTIGELQDFAIWMTGCGYDFCQHDYFCKKRDELLKT